MQCSATGQGTHREGFVVEFKDVNGAWDGNFQRGVTGFDVALEHPDGRSVIVIAGGQGYVVDRPVQRVTSMFGRASVTGVVYNGGDLLVFSTFTEFEAYGPAGHAWRTRRLSWDGFRSLQIDGDTLSGEGWTFAGDKWIEFSVQLATGEPVGGAYP
jgi:hypothetical protein